jgi:hypothetical protein
MRRFYSPITLAFSLRLLTFRDAGPIPVLGDLPESAEKGRADRLLLRDAAEPGLDLTYTVALIFFGLNDVFFEIIGLSIICSIF